MKAGFLVLGLGLLASPAAARPVVLEMFTSQACSSCPPADALLTQLAKDPHILALSFNVTYWNGPAWTDPYGLKESTARQAWYASLRNSQDVFTPEAVVDGMGALTGSDQTAVTGAIAAAQNAAAASIPITITGQNMVTIALGAGAGSGTIWLFGYDPSHTTAIGGGENGGARLTETNIVRSVTNLGPWTGQSLTYTQPRPAGEHVAVIIQTQTGEILGAASN